MTPPTSGPVTQGYGPTSFNNSAYPIRNGQRWHSGIDYGAACGAPVYAIGAGVVSLRDSGGLGYGRHAVIAHGDGIESFYGHLQAFDAADGQSVAAGQLIGRVGTTGNSTGCHLHFEVRINGAEVDPSSVELGAAPVPSGTAAGGVAVAPLLIFGAVMVVLLELLS